jgi:hypothetical protein
MLIFMLACGEDVKNTDEQELPIICEVPQDISCEDSLYLDLSLQDDSVSEGGVVTIEDGNDFLTTVDATAGGYSSAISSPWVYIKFTDTGTEKVEINDEEALASMEWDLSFRRFIIRVNGGTSGPSCVGAVSFLESSYDILTEVPEGLNFISDSFYSSDCTLINDSNGLPNSPQTTLGAWWEYPGCVKTTLYPHLIQLADGRIIKMVVEQYYAEGQDTCNTSGSPGSDGANISFRWTFMN